MEDTTIKHDTAGETPADVAGPLEADIQGAEVADIEAPQLRTEDEGAAVKEAMEVVERRARELAEQDQEEVEVPQNPETLDRYFETVGEELKAYAQKQEALKEVARQQKLEVEQRMLAPARQEFANLRHFHAAEPGSRLENWVLEKNSRLRSLEREQLGLEKRTDTPEKTRQLRDNQSAQKWHQDQIFYHAAPVEAGYIGKLAVGKGEHEQNMRRNFARQWGISEGEVSQTLSAINWERAAAWSELQNQMFSPEELQKHKEFPVGLDHLRQIKDPQLRIEQLSKISREQSDAGNFFAAETTLFSIPLKSAERQGAVKDAAFDMLERGAPLVEASEMVKKYIKDPEIHDQAIVDLWERSRGKEVNREVLAQQGVPGVEQSRYGGGGGSGMWMSSAGAAARAEQGIPWDERLKRLLRGFFRLLGLG